MELEEMVKALSPQQREALMTMLQFVTGNGNGLGPSGGQLEKPADGIAAWEDKLKVDGRTPTTINVYTTVARKYLANDPKPTAQSIRAHLARRLSVDGVGESAIRTEQKSLKSLFTFLYQEGLWPNNPLAGMKLMKETQRERECPSDEQMGALLYGDYHLHSKVGTLKFRTLLVILCDTGLRVSEAASILRENINLGKPMGVKVLGKGKKERSVPIGVYAATHIYKFLQMTAAIDSPYLFPGKDPARHWDVSSVEETLRRVCINLGIKPVVCHQIRHWVATRMLQNGAKLELVSRLLGHASVGITGDVYRHIGADELQAEHGKFSPLDRIVSGGRHSR